MSPIPAIAAAVSDPRLCCNLLEQNRWTCYHYFGSLWKFGKPEHLDLFVLHPFLGWSAKGQGKCSDIKHVLVVVVYSSTI